MCFVTSCRNQIHHSDNGVTCTLPTSQDTNLLSKACHYDVLWRHKTQYMVESTLGEGHTHTGSYCDLWKNIHGQSKNSSKWRTLFLFAFTAKKSDRRSDNLMYYDMTPFFAKTTKSFLYPQWLIVDTLYCTYLLNNISSIISYLFSFVAGAIERAAMI